MNGLVPRQSSPAALHAHLKYILVLVLALSWTAGASPAQDAPPRVAKIGSVTSETGVSERVFFGRVVARETVDLAFQVGGQILEFPPDEGATLEQGTLIARLDQEPFELGLEQAKATLDQATRTLERFRRLEGNAVSPVAVEDAETDLALASVALKDAERSLRLATLQAPFTALVAARNVANFSSIAAGTPVVRLHDMSDLRIEIEVPEIVFQQAGENPDIELLAQFTASSERYPLEFREFNAETTEVGQTFTITLGREPVAGLTVLPGSSVRVHTRLKQGDPRIEVPSTALIIANDGATSVMVFEPAGAAEGTLRLAAVEVEPTNFGTVAVMSGLNDGDEIVMSGAALLQDGETVRRFTGFTK